MALFVWFFMALQALGGEAAALADVRVAREAWVMGTRLRVEIDAPTRAAAHAASEAVVREVERLDRVLSTWDRYSEMAVANHAPAGRPVSVGRELAGLLVEAERWARATGRAFDPTVGPLVDAWGLRAVPARPSARELASARAAVGPGAFRVDPELGTVVRAFPLAWIDTGGFGKGAALRGVARLLEASGVRRAVVDLGGQLWVSGAAPLEVEAAHPERRAVPAARLCVRGASVATSGASERPGHILDPRTADAVEAWGSVTVVSDDPLEADALATALYVMGPAEGLAWAHAAGAAALFLVVGDGGGVEVRPSSSMKLLMISLSERCPA